MFCIDLFSKRAIGHALVVKESVVYPSRSLYINQANNHEFSHCDHLLWYFDYFGMIWSLETVSIEFCIKWNFILAKYIISVTLDFVHEVLFLYAPRHSDTVWVLVASTSFVRPVNLDSGQISMKTAIVNPHYLNRHVSVRVWYWKQSPRQDLSCSCNGIVHRASNSHTIFLVPVNLQPKAAKVANYCNAMPSPELNSHHWLSMC